MKNCIRKLTTNLIRLSIRLTKKSLIDFFIKRKEHNDIELMILITYNK